MKKRIYLLGWMMVFFGISLLNAQNTVPVTLKVIDETKGIATSDMRKVFSWVGMWDPSNETYENTGSWYANFFDGYTNGHLEKTDTEWTWSFTFDAPKGGSFSWDPRIGDPNGASISIKSEYGLVESSGADINFYVSSSGDITEGVAIVFSADSVILTDINGTVIVRKPYEPEDNSDNDFLHATGKWIFDGEGKRFTIRAVGLGNYMLFEPYMLGVTNNSETSRSDTHQALIRSFTELAGQANVDAFIDTYLDNYFAEGDLVYLKEAGFNSVRMSLHHELFIEKAGNNNAFIEKGFELVERVLAWCEQYEMYLILDMHCAPGGQSEDVWSVSDAYSPGLFEGNSEGTAAQYQLKYAILWGELARRFGDSPWIGGYELTNEINYNAWETAGQQAVRNLYVQLIDSVRRHDQKHLILMQGNWYGNDFTGLTPPMDGNMAYCFHHYWTTNTAGSIQNVLTIRNQYDVPILMTESGENSNYWFTNAVELLEDSQIGWAWWSYKKMESISGILSVPQPQGWDGILLYLKSETASSTLTQEQARDILMAFAENTKLANSRKNIDVIYALLEQPFNNDTKPFAENTVPGTIYATEYDLGRQGYAYFEHGLLGLEGIDQGAYNRGWAGRNDPVDVEGNNVVGGNGFSIGLIEEGEWLNYTIYTETAGSYNLAFTYAVEGGNGNLTVKVNGNAQISNFVLPNTNGWATYNTVSAGGITLNAGWNTVQLYFNASFNLSHFTLENSVSNVANLAVEDKYSRNEWDVTVTPDFVIYTLFGYTDAICFELFDLSGKKLFQKTEESLPAGTYRLNIADSGIKDYGVYLCKVTVDRNGKTFLSKTEKIIIE